MTTLHVVYDPTDRLRIDPPALGQGVKVASVPIANDLEGQDIYHVARRLAELLLEQLP